MKRIGVMRVFIIALTVVAIPLVVWNTPLEPDQDQADPDVPTPQHLNSPQSPTEYEPQISSKVMDELLAEDLSFTTSLFIDRMNLQLKRWSNMNISQDELDDQFAEEIKEHRHFHALAHVRQGHITFHEGEITEEKLQKIDLDVSEDQKVVYSTPYEHNEQQYMLVAYQQDDDEWLVGEVDLSFIQSFVGDLASVADADGNFFIAGEKPEVEWEEEDDREQMAEERVPELDWNVVVHSQPPETEKREYKDGEALVRFETEEAGVRWLEQNPAFKDGKHFGPYYLVQHDELSTLEMIDILTEEPEIISAEPNYIFEKQDVDDEAIPHVVDEELYPNDEFFDPYQWNLEQIEALEGWEVTEGDDDVLIAVLDTGIDPNHEDLQENMGDGHNAFTATDDVEDDQGHGTHVAGIAAAVTNNATGIAGVSWANTILPVKVLDENGEGGLYEIIEGIIWATDQGAQVINMSLGDVEHADMLHDAIQYAYDHDVVLIGASGNENVDIPMYPAAYDEVLAVSATDQHQQKANFSNYGTYIDVSAPGEHIPSTFLNDEYVFMSGTSMSAPHVAGMAGLIRSVNPDLTNEEVMDIIRHTATDLGKEGRDAFYGYGQINVQKALEIVQDGEEIDFPDQEENVVIDDERDVFEEDGRTRFMQWFDFFIEQFQR